MKVVFVSRSTLYTVRGGDTTQIEQTALHLRTLGVEVDIKLSNESIDYDQYDLIHFFNLIRPSDILYHQKKANLPSVISPIYVDYSEYDLNGRKGIMSFAACILGKFGTDYAKSMLRFIKGQDSMASLSYLLGHKRSMKQVIADAAILLPNSENEANRIRSDLNVTFDYDVIPNAIDTSLFKDKEGVERDPKLVLCVGQIEGRKNQHRLIEATRNLYVDLILIGRPSPNNHSYFDYCQRIAHERVRFIDFLDQNELVEWYNRAHVHVLPSWFETTGLTSLEAAACGCKIVVSENGDTLDYFDDGAEFCQAKSTKSIEDAIKRALKKDRRSIMNQRIEDEYNWVKTAEKTLHSYNDILG